MKKYTKIICMIAAVCLLGATAFCGFRIYSHYAHESKQEEVFEKIAEVVEQAQTGESETTDVLLTEEETVLAEYGELYLQNTDMVGWLSIAGTNINYPVMQTPNNPNYYLKHNFEKEYSDLGTPYVQENCDLFTSDNLVIYGHHIKGQKMFGALENYKSKDFYEEHKTINSTSNIDNSQILQKLSAIFNVGSESWLEVDFSRWGNNGTDNAKFELLKSAVIQQRCVKITYANSYGTISERIIQPLKVLYKSMSWYLKAYCTEKQDYRIFKLTRIITLEMLSDTFDKKSFPELDEMSGQVYSTIVLRFAKEISYRVYDEFDNTQISTEENGDLIVSVEMPEDEWLIGYLLSFGTQVDIVEPAHLKDIVAKQAKSIYEKYKS